MIPIDQSVRTRAATARDRNIVVTAGAGTGKTTLLVDRLLDLLLREQEPLAIGEIVALTFTNKAALEMKVRLRDRLLATKVNPLAQKALRELEASQIGTIHSFAAHLLRLHPLESGVDPAFRQDEGREFDVFFVQQWAGWLDQELGPHGSAHEIWRRVLDQCPLDQLEALARALSGEMIPLDGLAMSLVEPFPDVVRGWMETLAQQATALRMAHAKPLTIERMLDVAVDYLRASSASGQVLGQGGDDWSGVDRSIPPKTTTWEEGEYRQATQVLKSVQALRLATGGVLQEALELLLPFVRRCRTGFVQSGFISFDGLLARACALLRDHPHIRRRLKSQFRSMLVDEFQDTDPVQYEMILYLAEAPESEVSDWRQIRLEPGKLFIVGDPKQSIYAFRRADMEAYDAVVEDCILGQVPAGERHTLQTNFRSHHGLLAVMNALFSGFFPSTPIKGLQPKHDPLLAHEPGEAHHETERVELRLVALTEEEASAEQATRAEAESLARWIKEEVIGRETVMEQGVAVPIVPGHIAMLFRTLTAMRVYVEALRRHEIPCLTEGEKHFYERQEVIDAVTLLRAVANPYDRLALVGVLRSPVGGLIDREIAALARHSRLDYLVASHAPVDDEECAHAAQVAEPTYRILRRLAQVLPFLPVTEVMDHLYAEVPLLELAAASSDREHAVANLLKLRDLVEPLANTSLMTFSRLVQELVRRLREVPDEAESGVLEEESMGLHDGGAVRLMTVHKAKGLEFPIVILAELHRGPGGTDHRESPVQVLQDWSSGLVGVRVGDYQTPTGVYVAAKLSDRQEAERSRLLYVGMTRAKRRLVLSAGLPPRLSPSSTLGQVLQRLNLEWKDLSVPQARMLELDQAVLHLCVVPAPTVTKARPSEEQDSWQDAQDDLMDWRTRWQTRFERKRVLSERLVVLSPTLLKRTEAVARPIPLEPSLRIGIDGRLVGTLAHRMLEAWDFTDDRSTVDARVDQFCRIGASGLSEEDLQALRDELTTVFRTFVASSVYVDLCRADILGREVPFSISWDVSRTLSTGGIAPGQVMQGAIDLLYRLDGRLWIADYKTDHVTEEIVAERAREYDGQAQIYRQAIRASLGVSDVGFQFVFLRLGVGVVVR
jgi:ATP-dependent helicase/nuclease subunit A